MAAIAALLTSSCGGDDGGDAVGTTDPATTLPSESTAATTAPSAPSTASTPTSTQSATDETTATAPDTTATPATTTPATDPATTPATFEPVTTVVVGAAVGGSAGATGEESTDPFSEAVRNEDGTCTGWGGPGGTWTQGLESGAPVVFLARDSDTQIGTGTIGTSRWEDVGSDREQWNCVFPFEGQIEGEPDSFRIKVGDLPPWLVVRNAADPSQWVVSIDTTVRLDAFPECVDPGADRSEVSAWDSVGTYWSRGIPQQLCGSGLAVVDVERQCRPGGIASEHIVKVTRADDPDAVLEDSSGLLVDPAELAPGTDVVAHVATGRPC